MSRTFPLVISHVPECDGCYKLHNEIERLKTQHDEEMTLLLGIAEEERQKLLGAIRRESHYMDSKRVHHKDQDMRLKKIGHSKDVPEERE